MDIAELVRNSTILNIELHASFLLILVLLYFNMRKSFIRDGRRPEPMLTLVYVNCAIVLITDCAWSTVSSIGNVSLTLAYIINVLYFFSENTATVGWYLFCTGNLDSQFLRDKLLRILSLVPYAILMVLCLLSPWNGMIFSIRDGQYLRGILFFLDPVIKLGYIIGASVLALVCGRKRDRHYLRRKNYSLALYSVPVIVCGILQTATGSDFNCLGLTLGLILIYVTGVTNIDQDNIDTIYSLANSFDASYLVNIDTGEIRPLGKDKIHSNEFPEMRSRNYNVHFSGILGKILLPEDKEETLDTFELDNVVERFKIEKSYSIRYRVRDREGRTALHSASFIRASGRDGRQEFLLGINIVHPDYLLYERNVALSRENQILEQRNRSILLTVAKIVEARDAGSGEHIMRVKALTEILARDVMYRYPEFGLDEKTVSMISSASVLHDIGKIVIPDAVLLKPGRLTIEEFEIMKTHSAKGYDIINMLPLGMDDAFLGYAAAICRWHHEKYDGKGYPDGLKGEDIPIAAQIVSVADCFDALVNTRPYKKPFTADVACDMILNGECGVFSPKLMESLKDRREEFCMLAKQISEENDD